MLRSFPYTLEYLRSSSLIGRETPKKLRTCKIDTRERKREESEHDERKRESRKKRVRRQVKEMKRGKSDSLHSSHLFSCLLLSSPVLSLSVATHHTWCEGANRHPRSFRFVVHHTGGQCERELCETQRVFYLYLNRERREREEREKKKARCEEREM